MTAQTTSASKLSKPRSSKPRVTKKTAASMAGDLGTPVFMDAVGEEDGMEGLAGRRFPGLHTGPRTKQSHPYSYDPLLVFESRTPPTGSVYTDRFNMWYSREVIKAKMEAHFGDQSDYYSGRSPKKIEGFLRDLLGKPDLVLTTIEEHCNQATGYPVWYFAYAEPKAE